MSLCGNQNPGPRTGLTEEAEEKRRSSLFQPGNPGRPKGTRAKLTESFLKALYADFETYGAEAIQKVRETDPSTYLRVVARIVPLNLTAGDDEKVITEVIYRWDTGETNDGESRNAALLSPSVANSVN